MPTKFLEGIGNKLIEQWVANLLTPAFIFWLGGFMAAMQKFGWQPLQQWFTQLVEPLQLAVLFASLLLVATSAFAIQRFDLVILRWFEGYWPRWMNPIKQWLLTRQQRSLQRLDQRWQELAIKRDQTGQLTAEETDEFVQIDWQLRQFPAQPDRVMPTKLGNLLRAAESHPSNKYGLDAIICWPRLWLVLPDGVKKELQEARSDLNTAARVWLWGVLFAVWSVWSVWVLPIALLVTLFAHHWMLSAAATYGDLLESAFDLHRFELYKALHWPLPTNPAEEKLLGRQLTEYLWRGSDRDGPKFT
ncbi:hypothetical protein ACN4EG_18100 [Alkalinema pantanalense CENA528]|uniref:hypothetical protein n=1 Tax=Alkalinema pantanalense TaxID=1620705 RepID=UPI003D6EA1D1